MSPRVSHDAQVQAAFERMVAAGESPRLAEVLATRSFPGLKGTDSNFMAGRKLDGQQFERDPPGVGTMYVNQANKAGVNTTGKVYIPTLADFPGDPKAWVSGLSDVKARCEAEGWGCRGAVEVKEREFEPGVLPKKYAVAPEIVAAEVDRKIAAQPELARDREGLTHEIATQRAGVKGE